MALADDIAFWIRDQVDSAGLNGVIVGLSGGIDSATVAGLAARGLGRERVLGAIMPAHSQALDVEHAHLVADTFKIDSITIDLSDAFDGLVATLPTGNQLAMANLKPRLRMLTLYHLANTRGLMVVGTGNRSELMVGYFTKYGDGGVDLLPLGSLYKRDVRAVAREIGVPQAIIDRPPSAGLWEGQTDEGEMGISYEQLDGVLSGMDRGDTSAFPPDLVAKVEGMIARSAHKRLGAPIFVPAAAASTAGGALMHVEIDTRDEAERGALAGMIGAVAMLVAMMVDLALTHRKTNELRLLAGMVPGGRHVWPLVGTFMHVINGGALGALFGRIHHGLPGPPLVRGVIFGLVENILLWPVIIVLDHVHPGIKRGELERFNRPIPFLIELLRHAVFGAVLGAAFDFLTPIKTDD